MNQLHIPVLQDEILQALDEKKLRLFCDATVGNGGHARAILEAHPEIVTYFALDQDKSALALAKTSLDEYEEKTQFVHANFSTLASLVEEKLGQKMDGVLFDLGVSSMQLDQNADGFVRRGFSFLRNAPLDMRMNEENPLTAEEVVNEYPEKKLGEIFREFGEEPFWRSISKAIHQSRKKKRIQTTLELVEVIQTVKRRRGRLHPATLVFQALRIFVNGELKALEDGLNETIPQLNEEGILFVISFHSLEDRIVKQVFRKHAKEDDQLHIVTKKPLTAGRKEIRQNPRARSAKLRILERRGAS
ncbi:MAG: 16S rRNA (cytosine(1402)-N(4))-methyltransferase RsmH [Chlamydiota bacterium]